MPNDKVSIIISIVWVAHPPERGNIQRDYKLTTTGLLKIQFPVIANGVWQSHLFLRNGCHRLHHLEHTSTPLSMTTCKLFSITILFPIISWRTKNIDKITFSHRFCRMRNIGRNHKRLTGFHTILNSVDSK